VRLAFGFVELFEPLSESISLNASGSILGWIEGGRPPENFDADLVFLNFLSPTLKVFIAKILQQSGEPGRSSEQTRLENRLEFSPFLLY
jgi:hypothetical protein